MDTNATCHISVQCLHFKIVRFARHLPESAEAQHYLPPFRAHTPAQIGGQSRQNRLFALPLLLLFHPTLTPLSHHH